MKGRDCFKVWAPEGVIWSDWVRPVPFVFMSEEEIILPRLTLPQIDYFSCCQPDFALVLDLAGNDAIEEGIALAQLGWRPVPLYNASPAPDHASALVDNRVIDEALYLGTSVLQSISLPQNAPPAFLLDSNRTHFYKPHVSFYDNSWDIYPQDMPSGNLLLSQGIKNILVRTCGKKISKDLRIILHKYQSSSLKIWTWNGTVLLPQKIKKPKKLY